MFDGEMIHIRMTQCFACLDVQVRLCACAVEDSDAAIRRTRAAVSRTIAAVTVSGSRAESRESLANVRACGRNESYAHPHFTQSQRLPIYNVSSTRVYTFFVLPCDSI